MVDPSEFDRLLERRLTHPPAIAYRQYQAGFCGLCGLILRDCEYGLHQQAIGWSVGLCKCAAPVKSGHDARQLSLF